MMRIIKLLALVFVFVASVATTTQAADPVTVVEGKLQAAKARTDSVIQMVAKDFRDVRCPKQPSVGMQQACVIAHNIIIERERTEKAELDLELVAVRLPATQRDQLLNFVSDYDDFDKKTVAMSAQVKVLFPVPLESSSLEK